MNADQIMDRMGFPATETGPYVTALREKVAKDVSNGMTFRSAGTLAEECYERDEDGFIIGYKISAEDRAKEILAWDWEIEHGHATRVECIEPPIHKTFNTKTMRIGIRIHWRGLWPWLVTDRLRRLATSYRVWRNRAVRNPYRVY